MVAWTSRTCAACSTRYHEMRVVVPMLADLRTSTSCSPSHLFPAEQLQDAASLYIQLPNTPSSSALRTAATFAGHVVCASTPLELVVPLLIFFRT